MPKVVEGLTALDVKRLTHPGGKRNVLFSVGGVLGLHLQVTPKHGKSWVLRAIVGTLRRDIGLQSRLRLGSYGRPRMTEILQETGV